MLIIEDWVLNFLVGVDKSKFVKWYVILVFYFMWIKIKCKCICIFKIIKVIIIMIERV